METLKGAAWAGDAGRSDHDTRTGLLDQRGSRPVRRDGGKNRPPCGEVLEHLPGEDSLPPSTRVRDEQQERLGVALEPERLRARGVLEDPQRVAEPERLRPLAVDRAEVAHETRDRVESRVREGLEERARVAPPEEAARVLDPEARRR